MSEEKTFEQMLEESLISIRRGEVIQGTVISVKDDEIYVNIGYKSDGIIPKSEYSNYPGVSLPDEVKEGQTIRAKVLKVNDGDGQVNEDRPGYYDPNRDWAWKWQPDYIQRGLS